MPIALHYNDFEDMFTTAMKEYAFVKSVFNISTYLPIV